MTSMLRISFLLLLTLPLWAWAGVGTVHLVLKSEVMVSAGEVRLGDVADISTSQPDLRKALEVVVVGTAPRVGYVEQISRLQLMNLLKARQESGTAQIEWSGPILTKIRTSAQTVTAASISETAITGVQAQFAARFPSLEIKLATVPKDVAVPTGDLALRIRPVDAQQLYAKIAVWVDIFVNGNIYRSVVVPLYLQQEGEVLVARRNIPEGSNAMAADFELRRENVIGINGPVVKNALAGNAPRLGKAIAQGQILTSKHLVQSGAVLRGDWVKLIYADAAISLETRALAEQNGQIGDVIALKLNNNADSITGRIVSAGVVEVQGR